MPLHDLQSLIQTVEVRQHASWLRGVATDGELGEECRRGPVSLLLPALWSLASSLIEAGKLDREDSDRKRRTVCR